MDWLAPPGDALDTKLGTLRASPVAFDCRVSRKEGAELEGHRMASRTFLVSIVAAALAVLSLPDIRGAGEANALADTEAPQLVSVEIEPAQVDVSSAPAK